MLGNKSFAEANGAPIVIRQTTPGAWGVLLHFLYTEHSKDLDHREDEVVDVLQLANLYGCERLMTMCELYVSKMVESATSLDIRSQGTMMMVMIDLLYLVLKVFPCDLDDVDLIALLNLANDLGAKQLEAFLLHFFCVNYEAVTQRADFETLQPIHRNHIEANKWPPQSFYDAVSLYEEKHAEWSKRQGKAKGESTGLFGRLFGRMKAVK
jgi:hypothetical protein